VPSTHFVSGPSCLRPKRQYPNGQERIEGT